LPPFILEALYEIDTAAFLSGLNPRLVESFEHVGSRTSEKVSLRRAELGRNFDGVRNTVV